VALLILAVGDQEPERKTQGEVLLNAYSRELERRRLAAGAQGLLHVSGGRIPPTFCSAFLLSFPQRAMPSLMKMIQMKSSTTLGLPLQTRHHVHPRCVSRRQTTLAARPHTSACTIARVSCTNTRGTAEGAHPPLECTHSAHNARGMGA
jgi:hypothetical protein